MSMTSLIPPVVFWRDEKLVLLDQTKLPEAEVYLDIQNVTALIEAIQRLAVRGAPALGCAGAYGVVLAARECRNFKPDQWSKEFDARCESLADARPTAVNLRWAVERTAKVAHELFLDGHSKEKLEAGILNEALAIHAEDQRMCAAIGKHGASLFIGNAATLITHCNAGALATGGSGTALSVFYALQERKVAVTAFADETRPLLQGARLTAWELSRSGIPTTVICDNMAASVLRDKKVSAAIVGADRIAANGDTANKIGTYGLAILCHYHQIPFYVAAPSSTFDLKLKDGSGIPIEERKRSEIAESHGKVQVPQGANVFNPAFDVTPAKLISAIITEKGVLKAPYEESIAKLLT
jgi:methylthioribose-1-phosphate isomerase